jgi:RND family efflux transporter MFP subunit
VTLTAETISGAISSARAMLKSSAESCERRQIHFPIILHKLMSPWQGAARLRRLTSGTFLFTLMHGDVIRIRLYVPQDEAFGIAPGVDAVVRVPEMPGRDFPGKVTRIADALQPGTRTLLTEIDVPNPGHELSPGVYCTIDLKIPRKTPSLIVPSEAIIFNREGLSVAVVEDGVARIRVLTVVRDFGTNVEVSAGVKEGDQVVLNPPVDLTDGRALRIRPSPVGQSS